VFWRQHSLTVALAGILHQAWCCASEQAAPCCLVLVCTASSDCRTCVVSGFFLLFFRKRQPAVHTHCSYVKAGLLTRFSPAAAAAEALTTIAQHHNMAVPSWCCPAVNFVIVVAITETTKSFSGDLRPDFLARCQPAPPSGSPPGDVSNHISDAAVQLSAVHIGEIASCTNPNTDQIREGRFVSMHAQLLARRAWRVGIHCCWYTCAIPAAALPTAEAACATHRLSA
jgi:hypothetical protein